MKYLTPGLEDSSKFADEAVLVGTGTDELRDECGLPILQSGEDKLLVAASLKGTVGSISARYVEYATARSADLLFGQEYRSENGDDAGPDVLSLCRIGSYAW